MQVMKLSGRELNLYTLHICALRKANKYVCIPPLTYSACVSAYDNRIFETKNKKTKRGFLCLCECVYANIIFFFKSDKRA
jgi:hypothetical protein